MFTSKAEIRKMCGSIRKNISDREAKETAINKNLNLIADKHSVFCYVSFGSEADTHAFLKNELGKRELFVPFTQKNEMRPVKLLSVENLTTDSLGNIPSKYTEETDVIPDMVVVPMLAFNDKNYRLGYGGGYYDRYLANYKGMKVGLAFDEQFAQFPVEKFDVPLDIIITPTGMRRG